ncbi:hypothetical protein J6590_039502 [Homalodisca vitripennis]|nr:hypothetical protein J6590_039502 [Homalodisca vitripennis]
MDGRRQDSLPTPLRPCVIGTFLRIACHTSRYVQYLLHSQPTHPLQDMWVHLRVTSWSRCCSFPTIDTHRQSA